MFLKYIVSLHTYQYNYIAYTKQELKLQDLKNREKTTSKIKKKEISQGQWYTPVVPVLWKLR